jgi:hypothetical protein
MHYHIRLKGHLDRASVAWLGDFIATHTPEGDTLLTGEIVDQAALYGVLGRCRDTGMTLVSIHSVERNTTMSKIHAEASHVIAARPEAIYAVLSDYRVGHPAILPKPYFTDLIVEKGGQGAGTMIRVYMSVFGRKYSYHQLVSEPKPGRILQETDIETGQYSRFTLEPLSENQTRVTIFTEIPTSAGFMGIVEKLTTPSFTRRLFKEELRNLEAYVQRLN